MTAYKCEKYYQVYFYHCFGKAVAVLGGGEGIL